MGRGAVEYGLGGEWGGLRREAVSRVSYLDQDGFFAAVCQVLDPSLRGKPVGVVPHAGHNRILIAANYMAKQRGVESTMPVRKALQVCPDLKLAVQEPARIRRAQLALLAEIDTVAPIQAVKSIDEIVLKLDDREALAPEEVGRRIKDRMAKYVSPILTCSIGVAQTRLLAKMACKTKKPDGIAIWRPEDLPEALYGFRLTDIPGIAKGMQARLNKARIWDVEALLMLSPREVRKITGSLIGERLSLALHGYDLPNIESSRGAYSHGRVLSSDQQKPEIVREILRALLVKAGRRMRVDGHSASLLRIELGQQSIGHAYAMTVPAIADETGLLASFDRMWREATMRMNEYTRIGNVMVLLGELSRTDSRQLDLLADDENYRRKQERVTAAMDGVNARYSSTMVYHGTWSKQASDMGNKISYGRIPSAADFW